MSWHAPLTYRYVRGPSCLKPSGGFLSGVHRVQTLHMILRQTYHISQSYKPSATLTLFSTPVEAVYRGVAAVACVHLLGVAVGMCPS